MAINQSQVDHIISTASADDPEVKLQNLQDEVDLLKKSVKKLLIDLRERLNETENPFIVTAISSQVELPSPPKTDEITKAADLREEKNAEDNATEKPQEEILPDIPGNDSENTNISGIALPGNIPADNADLNSLMLLKRQIEDIENSAAEIPAGTRSGDRPRLQKLHRLFEWVSRMVKKYGHDRLLIMIESYRTMGYISEDACGQVKEISKLMPESIGDSHEISSEEFVAELYVLNRILSPEDPSLDREMIEVMMEKRESGEKKIPAGHSGEETSEEDWIDMLEKI